MSKDDWYGRLGVVYLDVDEDLEDRSSPYPLWIV